MLQNYISRWGGGGVKIKVDSYKHISDQSGGAAGGEKAITGVETRTNNRTNNMLKLMCRILPHLPTSLQPVSPVQADPPVKFLTTVWTRTEDKEQQQPGSDSTFTASRFGTPAAGSCSLSTADTDAPNRRCSLQPVRGSRRKQEEPNQCFTGRN